MSSVLRCEREGVDDGSPVCSHFRVRTFAVVPKREMTHAEAKIVGNTPS